MRDAAGALVDSANLNGGGWPAGSGSPLYLSMERVNPYEADADTNWRSNNRLARNGRDAQGNLLNGTAKTWNSTAIVADLVVLMTGPAYALRGTIITYTLALSNTGRLSATEVTLTDTLPPGVDYWGTNAPYTLTRPDDRTLVWDVGTLPAFGGPVRFGLTVRLTKTITGVVTNAALISTSSAERDLIDNRSEWNTEIGEPPPFADLVVTKDGPSEVAAGTLITYQITLGNQGSFTATGVVVTDQLPAAVRFLAHSGPISFTQPVSGLLSWRIPAVSPGAPPPSWTVTGLVADGASGMITNTVLASTITTETDTADNRATLSSNVLYTPTVLLAAVHYYALQGDDEAVLIANLGCGAADVGGWMLTDQDRSAIVIPAGVRLAPGEAIWLAEEGEAFFAQFGMMPALEARESVPEVPNLAGSWPRLGNNGDEVVLTDAGGALQDVLVYKEGDINQPGWVGPALQPYHPGALAEEGQILYRKLDQASGRPVADTDTAGDWAQEAADPANGRKVRYPGWDLDRFFQTLRVTQTASLTISVGPDGLYEMVSGAVNRAAHSLVIQSYTFENSALAREVAARASAGVSVTILLEGNPVGGVTDQQRWVCQEIKEAGGRCYFMINDGARDIYDRYSQLHAKYMIVDGEWVLIGSENPSLESMPWDDKANGTAGRRGVYVATDAPAVVQHMEALFAADWDPVRHRDIATSAHVGPPPVGYVPITATDWISYTALFTTPLALHGELAIEVIQSPENGLRDADALLGLLARVGAGDTVMVEQMTEPPHWGEHDSDPLSDPNLRLEAYIAAARRGAVVRVLLDGFFSPEDSWSTCTYLWRGVRARRPEVVLRGKQPHDDGYPQQDGPCLDRRPGIRARRQHQRDRDCQQGEPGGGPAVPIR